MRETQSLSHTKWDCKYYIVFIPKCRRKSIYGDLRQYLGDIFHDLATHKGCEILEGHLKWVRGYDVSTVGIDENTVRNYIRQQ